MEYRLIRSKRKTLALKIIKDGNLVVLAPNKCSLKYIEDFVISKKDWILKHQQSMKEINKSYEEYTNLDKLIIFGESYELLEFSNHYEVGDYYIKHTKASNKQKIIKEFFNKLANDYIIARTKEIAEKLNLKYKNAKIISARKKWGSCNSLKELKYNFRLVMIPKGLIDYVICHELCHLTELNHSTKFWSLMRSLGYEKSKIKAQMKPYGFVLELL